MILQSFEIISFLCKIIEFFRAFIQQSTILGTTNLGF